MIYFDNSATTMPKPPEVAEAVGFAIRSFGNAGRSIHDAAMQAARAVFESREAVAFLVGSKDPLSIAFTSSATESLNLVISGLLGPHDHAITTITEHNSVLRPLYNTGCELSFIKCEKNGRLILDGLEDALQENTKCLVCTHGSNLTGNVTDTEPLKDFCKTHGLLFVLDAAQTMGIIHTKYDDADFLCFTGHKSLLGPQGTGGIVCRDPQSIRILKTGGDGANSFAPLQYNNMPNVFEAGTTNSHGIYGLKAGVDYIINKGIDSIYSQTAQISDAFLAAARGIRGITVYGDINAKHRLPIVSLNIGDMDSDIAAARLWYDYEIATRSGILCAPLLHEHFGTAKRGMVRFSFSHFNTLKEIDYATTALEEITSGT